MFAVVFAQFVGDGCFGFGGFGRLDRRPHDEFQALFLQQFLELLLHFAVHAGGDDIQEFDDGDLGPEPFVDRPQFQPDDACADHDQLLWHFAKRQGACGGDDRFFVDFDPVERRGLGP